MGGDGYALHNKLTHLFCSNTSANVHLQEPKSLEDLTGLTELHAETHARSMSLQAGGSGSTHDLSGAPGEDNASIPDIDDEWTSL